MRLIEALILLVIAGQVATEHTLTPLVDFGGPAATDRWQAVNGSGSRVTVSSSSSARSPWKTTAASPRSGPSPRTWASRAETSACERAPRRRRFGEVWTPAPA